MQSDIVLSSRVRLARNYADLPFDLASEPEQAETCILRTLSALRQAGLEEQYDLLRLRDMSDVSRRAIEESHLVSRDLLRSPETAAVLVKQFVDNFAQFADHVDEGVRQAAPQAAVAA